MKWLDLCLKSALLIMLSKFQVTNSRIIHMNSWVTFVQFFHPTKFEHSMLSLPDILQLPKVLLPPPDPIHRPKVQTNYHVSILKANGKCQTSSSFWSLWKTKLWIGNASSCSSTSCNKFILLIGSGALTPSESNSYQAHYYIRLKIIFV